MKSRVKNLFEHILPFLSIAPPPNYIYSRPPPFRVSLQDEPLRKLRGASAPLRNTPVFVIYLDCHSEEFACANDEESQGRVINIVRHPRPEILRFAQDDR
jgi:hypothetical protein